MVLLCGETQDRQFFSFSKANDSKSSIRSIVAWSTFLWSTTTGAGGGDEEVEAATVSLDLRTGFPMMVALFGNNSCEPPESGNVFTAAVSSCFSEVAAIRVGLECRMDEIAAGIFL